jgi:regulator of sirC expression with transglutaminase-like and TPR domain
MSGPIHRASAILAACDQAIALKTDDHELNGRRGVARAQAGDFAGAATDFALYIQWLTKHQADKGEIIAQHEAWLTTLEAGSNPFDAEAIEVLRKWYWE